MQFFGVYPGTELLDHMGILFNFLRNQTKLSCTVAVPFDSPTTAHRGLNFSTSSPTPVVFCVSENSHPNGVPSSISQSPRGFPGGSVVKNLPGNAGDTHRFDPRSRKIPHAPEQLSSYATTIELVTPESHLLSPHAATTEVLEPVLRSKRRHCSEKPAHGN